MRGKLRDGREGRNGRKKTEIRKDAGVCVLSYRKWAGMSSNQQQACSLPHGGGCVCALVPPECRTRSLQPTRPRTALELFFGRRGPAKATAAQRSAALPISVPSPACPSLPVSPARQVLCKMLQVKTDDPVPAAVYAAYTIAAGATRHRAAASRRLSGWRPSEGFERRGG